MDVACDFLSTKSGYFEWIFIHEKKYFRLPATKKLYKLFKLLLTQCQVTLCLQA